MVTNIAIPISSVISLHIMTYLKSHFQHKTGKINRNKQNKNQTIEKQKREFSRSYCVHEPLILKRSEGNHN